VPLLWRGGDLGAHLEREEDPCQPGREPTLEHLSGGGVLAPAPASGARGERAVERGSRLETLDALISACPEPDA